MDNSSAAASGPRLAGTSGRHAASHYGGEQRKTAAGVAGGRWRARMQVSSATAAALATLYRDDRKAHGHQQYAPAD
jgi:hypothetical protein